MENLLRVGVITSTHGIAGEVKVFPTTEPSTYNVDAELAKKWLANGAQPTEVVAKIFKLAGVEK